MRLTAKKMRIPGTCIMGGNSSQLITSPEGLALCEMVKCVLPPLNHSSHKGQAGRIGIIGGCQEYTGAPYFAGISALKVGADLSHIFCTRDAATVIKSYSPELIVHPVLDLQNAVGEIEQWLPRLHALVIGPGLGRNLNPNVIKDIITLAKGMDMPLVIDADGLFYVCQDVSLIKNYSAAILTPNIVEFARLHKAVLANAPSQDGDQISQVKAVSQALGNVTVVQKGDKDLISNGNLELIVDSEGSPRRCGGQGDLLSGSMGAFAHWTTMAFNNKLHNEILNQYGPTMCAAYGACLLTRECSRLAFLKYRRSMLTSNMIEEIQTASETLFA